MRHIISCNLLWQNTKWLVVLTWMICDTCLVGWVGLTAETGCTVCVWGRGVCVCMRAYSLHGSAFGWTNHNMCIYRRHVGCTLSCWSVQVWTSLCIRSHVIKIKENHKLCVSSYSPWTDGQIWFQLLLWEVILCVHRCGIYFSKFVHCQTFLNRKCCGYVEKEHFCKNNVIAWFCLCMNIFVGVLAKYVVNHSPYFIKTLR